MATFQVDLGESKRMVVLTESYKSAIILWLSAMGGLLALSLTGVFLILDKVQTYSIFFVRYDAIIYFCALAVSIPLIAVAYIDTMNLCANHEARLFLAEKNIDPKEKMDDWREDESQRTKRLTTVLWSAIVVSGLVLLSLIYLACTMVNK